MITNVSNSAGAKRRALRGFTLIELLVVIAIIAILAAILFPVFAKAREKARQTACLSNVKQLSLAFLQYTQDFDEALPLSGQNSHGNTTTVACMGTNDGSWVLPEAIDLTVSTACTAAQLPVPNGSIYNYVKSTQVYKCPSDPLADQKTLSYSMNTNLSGRNNAAIEAPAGCVLLVDESDTLNNGNFAFAIPASYLPDAYATYPDTPIRNDKPTDRHTDGAVFAFVDGHSKWSRPERLKVANFDPKATP